MSIWKVYDLNCNTPDFTGKEKNMDALKKKILENEGYDFVSELLCFVNRKAGKIFSNAWIDEKNINTVQISLSLPHNPTMWKLFLNPDQPHEEIRAELFEKYGRTP